MTAYLSCVERRCIPSSVTYHMKIKMTYLVLIAMISCQSVDQNGLWISIDNEEENYSFFNIENDSIIVKQIIGWNYWVYNEEVKLPRTNKFQFENDSLKVMLSKHIDKVLLYRDDSLVQTINLERIEKFESGLTVDDLKECFKNKLWTYEIGNIKKEINFINENTSFDIKDTVNNTHLNYFDIFKLGTELFLIPQTDSPTPIQVETSKHNEIKGNYYLYNKSEEIDIMLSELPKQMKYLNGNWKTHLEFENESIELKVNFQNSKMIETFKMKKDTLDFQVLSDHNHIAIYKNTQKPYKLRIDKISDEQIEIRDYRRRNSKNEKLRYTKIE